MKKNEQSAGFAEGEEAVFLVCDEDGTEREMVPALTFECGGRGYMVLIDRNDGEADGVILRIEQDEEELVLDHIEDDDEWEAVVRKYEELLDEDSCE